MKRTICYLLACLFWVGTMAQSVELIRIYTDKTCYLAGEDLWVRLSLDDETLPGNEASRVAYVEICDTAQVRAQAKVDLRQGTGWACVHLPQTMHSGVYQLTAYTRYMRNLEPDCFPRKYVAVLNARGASDEDQLTVNDTTAWTDAPAEAAPVGRAIKSDKSVYGLREKVSLTWSDVLEDARELTLSVVRKDCETLMPAHPEAAIPVPAKGERWVAECEGHIVTGQMEGTEFPEDLTAQLSCMGKEMKVFTGQRKENGLFRFYTYGVNNQQDIVLSTHSNLGVMPRMNVVTPFAELLPKELPVLHTRFEDSALVSRSVALQLMQAMPRDPLPKPLADIIYGYAPSKSYNLDEYVRFNTVQECNVEFVMGVSVEKQGDKRVIKMLQEDAKAYNLFPVLVLLDGVPFYNHDDVLAYNAHQVHYIHQYRGTYYIGGNYYGGILSLITYRGVMADMRISSNMQMLAYEFPQHRPAFEAPDYGVEEQLRSRKPDFRHTLYWAPSVEGSTGVEFYTSDLEGTYVATLQGVSSRGEKVAYRYEFTVKDDGKR